jgi:hypothetical protein
MAIFAALKQEPEPIKPLIDVDTLAKKIKQMERENLIRARWGNNLTPEGLILYDKELQKEENQKKRMAERPGIMKAEAERKEKETLSIARELFKNGIVRLRVNGVKITELSPEGLTTPCSCGNAIPVPCLYSWADYSRQVNGDENKMLEYLTGPGSVMQEGQGRALYWKYSRCRGCGKTFPIICQYVV